MKYSSSPFYVIAARSTMNRTDQLTTRRAAPRCCLSLFHDLLSRSYVYQSVWSVVTADNFTPAKRDVSFSAMFAEP